MIMDIEKIMTEGVFFKKAKAPKTGEEKVKTKAKKKDSSWALKKATATL